MVKFLNQKLKTLTYSKHCFWQSLYAPKHTGNIEYLFKNKGNVDLKWQQMQNRRKTSTMTDRYNRKLDAYFIDETNVKFREL